MGPWETWIPVHILSGVCPVDVRCMSGDRWMPFCRVLGEMMSKTPSLSLRLRKAGMRRVVPCCALVAHLLRLWCVVVARLLRRWCVLRDGAGDSWPAGGCHSSLGAPTPESIQVRIHLRDGCSRLVEPSSPNRDAIPRRDPSSGPGSGNKAEIHFHFISSFGLSQGGSGNIVETHFHFGSIHLQLRRNL